MSAAREFHWYRRARDPFTRYGPPNTVLWTRTFRCVTSVIRGSS
jgi:hypothetical protein